MDKIANTISNLVKTSFSERDREFNPLFVEFITQYFKWLETKSAVRATFFCTKELVKVQAGSPTIIGLGTSFTTQFSNGDSIAICKGLTSNDYDIFQIDTIANNTVLTLKDDFLPGFSKLKTRYAPVSERANPNFYTRNFFTIKDIDNTFDEFVLLFKEKYLKNIQFDTNTDTRLLVKHSLDLYRSKGTERSIDLLYKVVFGKPAKVYYPGQDIFRLSSGEWYIPQYLELTMSPANKSLINKQIRGTLSGAVAFVEEIIRTKSNNKIVEIAYISEIKGSFMTGEKVTLFDNTLDINDCPTIVGSLNEVEISVDGSGGNFENNEILSITSENGTSAQGKVISTANSVGTLSYTLLDGGYGYSANIQLALREGTVAVNTSCTVVTGTGTTFPLDLTEGGYIGVFSNSTFYEYREIEEITSNTTLTVASPFGFTNTTGNYGHVRLFSQTYISEKILRISNVEIDMDYTGIEYVPFLYEIVQPMATINYVEANGTFEVGQEIATMDGANVLGLATIMQISRTNATDGTLTITYTGDMDEASIVTYPDEDIGANVSVVNGFSDMTATANVIGSYANVTITTNNHSDVFLPDEIIRQESTGAFGTVIGGTLINNNYVISIANTFGIFKNDSTVQGQTSGSTAHVIENEIEIGVVDISNTFLLLDHNKVYANNLEGSISLISTGSGANIEFANTLSHTETIQISNTFIEDHLSEALDDIWVGFAVPNANLNTVIADALFFSNLTIGKANSILRISPGSDYNRAPIVRLFEPTIYRFDIPDTVLITLVSNPGFIEGEIITQSATNARGMIKTAADNLLEVQNLRFYSNNSFVATSNSTTSILGATSAKSANVSSIETVEVSRRFGNDLETKVNLTVSGGSITSVKVTDSGIGFVNGEVVTLASGNNTAEGFAILQTHGTGEGFYKTRDGFLSDTKKLSDGFYYQEYSYDVRASVINDFKDILKNITHVAGTKYFSSLFYDTLNISNTQIETTVTIDDA